MTPLEPARQRSQTAADIQGRQRASGTPARVVVGIDGSWPARAALQWAARYARATQSVLCAVRVLEWPVGFHSASQRRPEPTLHVPDSEVGQSYRDGMLRIFDEADPLPDWNLTFAEGPTAQTLVQLAQDADLLVIGSREHAASGSTQAGDTGHYCTSHSRTPVVIVPVEYLKQSQPLATAMPGPPRPPGLEKCSFVDA